MDDLVDPPGRHAGRHRQPLVLDPAAIRAAGTAVVDEDGGDGELYPHIYGPIRPSFVTEVRPAALDAEGRFHF